MLSNISSEQFNLSVSHPYSYIQNVKTPLPLSSLLRKHNFDSNYCEGSHASIFRSIGFIIYGGKKKTVEDLTFLLLVSRICITASLYSPLHLTNEQSVSNIQNLLKTEYKQNGFAWLGVMKGWAWWIDAEIRW